MFLHPFVIYYENWAENRTVETIEKVTKNFNLSANEFVQGEQDKKGGCPSRMERLLQEIQILSAYKQNIVLDMLEVTIGRK